MLTAQGRRRRMGFMAVLVVVIMAGLAAFAGACSDSGSERARAAALTAGCAIDSDCEGDLVCAFERCHEECRSNKDCPGRANCVKSDQDDVRICQLESEVDCTRNSDCFGDQVCAIDGECRDGCEKKSECAEQQVCVKGEDVCAAEDEVNEAGLLIIEKGKITVVSVSGECPEGEVCAAGPGLVTLATAAGDGDSDGGDGDMTAAGDGDSGDGDVTVSGDGDSGDGDSGDGDSSKMDAGAMDAGPPPRGDLQPDAPCMQDTQCQSGICDVVCQLPTCDDGVQNGNEQDVDCGGRCLARCGTGSDCEFNSDCQSGYCKGGVCTPISCPSEPGVAKMVSLPAGFCMDSTEVTRKQYSAWLATAPRLADQRTTGCVTNNTTFSPESGCMADGRVCKDDCDDHAQVCVDWCDADAYCEGVGKRLCTHANADQVFPDAGVGFVPNYPGNTVESEWYYACSTAGNNQYVYGGTNDTSVCNTELNTTAPVGSFDGCQSPDPAFAGVYDLTGSVEEWVANYDGTNMVVRRSHSYDSQTCSSTRRSQPLGLGPYLGFRCCATPF